MVMTYRRPGVYLEESLLVNPSDTAGTVTVAAFVGVAQKGPVNEPALVESWSSYVSLFGDFNPITVPPPVLNVTSRLPSSPATLAALKGDAANGDGKYVGPDFEAGQYVLLGDASKAHYLLPALATNRGAAVPNTMYAADPDITASDAPNAAKLAAEGFVASPTSAWTSGQKFWIGGFAFYWTGSAWAAGQVGGGTVNANNGTWVADAYPGTPASKLPPVLSYLPFAVYSFFQNGGRFAWIIRAVDDESAGAYSTITINGPENGEASNQSFKLIARSVGAWGNNVQYQLVTRQTVTDDPSNPEDIFTLQILYGNEVVETWQNLSIKGTIPGTRRIDTALNDASGGAGSQYVRCIEVNTDNPQPIQTDTAIALTGGVDPGVPGPDGLVSAAQDQIPRLEGPITLNIVGYLEDARKQDALDASSVWVSATMSSASFTDRQDIFIVNDCAPPRDPGNTSGSYKTKMMSYLGQYLGDSYSAAYGPWIIIPNPSSTGSTIAIPPGGAVIGMMARIDSTVGVFRAPAGVIAGLSNAVGVQTRFSDTELGDLNAQNINVIRSVVGAGICCMGGRTRKTYGADRYVSARRTLIYIKEVMRRTTQFAVFENNDQRLWTALRMTGERVLRPLWEQGGLRGSTASQAYFIRCDSTLNTSAVIQSGEVRMELGVALEYPAEFVIIRVTQFDQGLFTTEVIPTA